MKLNSTSLFKNISDEDCVKMWKCFDIVEKNFSSGEVLYDFNTNASYIGILIDGRAEVVRLDINGMRTILETLENGSIFGSLFSYYSADEDSVNIVCSKDCRVIFIHKEHITKRCKNTCACHTMVVENLLSFVSAKTVYLSARIEILSRRSIRKKLLCYFKYCSKGDDKSFEIPFSLSSLADYIGADRSAMMRELKKMREEGVLTINKRKFIINKH